MNNIQHKNLPPKIFNLKGWIKLIHEEELKVLFDKTLSKSGFTSLNYSSHQFPVAGFTAFWLLAESHLALHTFTENGWCYIELSSCNKEKTIQFKQLTNQLSFEVKWDDEIQLSEPSLAPELTL
ncbi:S-adenosylmethionine decarboxylase [Labilibacter marinus]|uniref:S-adenosylmethionine decarboxylase n=1 Tax=Labilibacter marinus TaxID=1477105 RepID=UPI00094F624B|nr:S-adenosylmethionine decarboxylase [Labilibacter marinus]